jgi:hypothetical protein
MWMISLLGNNEIIFEEERINNGENYYDNT